MIASIVHNIIYIQNMKYSPEFTCFSLEIPLCFSEICIKKSLVLSHLHEIHIFLWKVCNHKLMWNNTEVNTFHFHSCSSFITMQTDSAYTYHMRNLICLFPGWVYESIINKKGHWHFTYDTIVEWNCQAKDITPLS